MREYRLRLDEYGISGARYRELLNMCRQYDEMRRDLEYIRQGVDRPGRTGNGGNVGKDPTGVQAAKVADSWYAARIYAIEQAAIAADPALCRYILLNVTRGTKYEHMDVPRGRRQFFDARRRFFWELDQRI